VVADLNFIQNTIWRILMKFITKLLAATAFFAPASLLAANPGAVAEACCVIASCCGLPCC